MLDYTVPGIKTLLNGWSGSSGKDKWSDAVIRKMLRNEKYKGGTMQQKTYSKNYLAGERTVNHGQRTRYYVNDSHPAILSKEIFDRYR